MNQECGGWTESLSNEELEFSKRADEKLQSVAWAESLLNEAKIKKALEYDHKGGSTGEERRQAKSSLFEVRFAAAIHEASRQATYEWKTGEGHSSVDFRIHGLNDEPDWLVELTSFTESKATKENTLREGPFDVYRSLTPPNAKENSPEVLDIKKAQNVILNKVTKEENGRIVPIKFPDPSDNVLHAVIVDMRGIAVGGSPDWGDYWNIVYGTTDDLPPEFRLQWIVNGKSEPMKGIFDPNHPDPTLCIRAKKNPCRWIYL